MNIIEIAKTLPDGRVLRFHRVFEVQFSAESPGFVTVVLGSWATEEDAHSQQRPAATSSLVLPNDAAVQKNDFIKRVVAQKGWKGAKLKDAAGARQGINSK